MGLGKKIKTARQIGGSAWLQRFPKEERSAIYTFYHNPPIAKPPHLYSENFMNLPLSYTGDSPLDIHEAANYLLVDITSNAQSIVWVYRDNNGKQMVLRSWETREQELSKFNQWFYRWLKIDKLPVSEFSNIRSQPLNLENQTA